MNKFVNFIRTHLFSFVASSLVAILTIAAIVVSNFADKPIFIENIEQFSKIEETGLDKHYVITGFLNFVNWDPIGDENHPFTGILEARNPINITSFKTDADKPIGLFSVNSGTILGVKVYNPLISQKIENSNCFGLYAGINKGKISSCNIFTGKIDVNFSTLNETNCGGFCGINYGDVRKCTVSSAFSISTKGKLNFGCAIGTSLNGISEYCCSNANITSINATSYFVSSFIGNATNTLIQNNYVTGKSTYISPINGYYGCVLGHSFLSSGINVVDSCYVITSTNKQYNSSVGTYIGLVEQSSISISNSVSNAKVTNIIEGKSGIFFAQVIEEKIINNSYFLENESSFDLIYGSKATFRDLSLSLLKWNEAIWSITSDRIDFLIVYE